MVWVLAALVVFHLALRLAFASVDLHGDRFWDERFGLENLGSLVGLGRLAPANGYHPSLSYLPQAAVLGVVEALHRATGDERLRLFRPVRPERGDAEPRRVEYTPLAFLLCRITQALFGAASLVVVYWIGARLFSPHAGLLAAAILGAMPWHVRQSAIYKPDILLLLTTALAFLLVLRAFERPTTKRFALAGVGIGLALASKFNAAPVFVPLVVGALVAARRDRRLLRSAALACAVAVAVFLALNPYVLVQPRLYVEDFSVTVELYEQKGATIAGGSPPVVLAHGVRSLLSDVFLGYVAGALALLGLIAFGTGRWPHGETRDRRMGRALAASYVIGYAVAYALATSNASPHNWLPVTPFLAVLAAGLVVTACERLFVRGATAPPRLLLPAALVALLALVTVRPTRYVYEDLVPTTAAQAADILLEHLSDGLPRVVAVEERVASVRMRPAERSAGVPAVLRFSLREDQSGAGPQAALHDADATIVLARDAAASDVGADVDEARPRWFRRRGPALHVVIHPWRQVGTAETLAWELDPDGRIAAVLPPFSAEATRLSLELLLRAPEPLPEVASVELGTTRLEWLHAGRSARRYRWITPRVAANDASAAEERIVRLAVGPEDLPGAHRIELRLYRWAPPDVAAGASSSAAPSRPDSEVSTETR